MFISYWHFIQAFLFAGACYWVYVVIRRFPDDVREFREVKEGARRFAIVFVWFLTVPIAIVVFGAALAILARILSAARELL
jgi:hypothetical protein